jgi:signal transduction histidine kinase
LWSFETNTTKELRQAHSQLESLVLQRTSELENLSQRLLKVQDEERRRVARDLHDSVGQTLTALKISVALLERKLGADAQARNDFAAIECLADQALQEIRTTSHLLHPPLLEEAGFATAADLYLNGFGKRSAIKVRMDFAPDFERMPDKLEIALFRVLQESLTNVHRHSGASKVDVVLRREAQTVILEVRDYGCGISEELLNNWGPSLRGSGVGVPGMRERLRELNGTLEIEAAEPGTRVRATVPLTGKHHLVIVDSGVIALHASQAVAPTEPPAVRSAHSWIFDPHPAMGSILDRYLDR